MFHPGETIAHTFTLPYEKGTIDKVIISYRQKDQLILEKIITSDVSMQETDDNQTIVSSVLSESESLLFHDLTTFAIQINVFFGDGEIASGRVTSDEIGDMTGIQHIRELGKVAAREGFGTMYINDDGCLIYEKEGSESPFAIDHDNGFLVITREVT